MIDKYEYLYMKVLDYLTSKRHIVEVEYDVAILREIYNTFRVAQKRVKIFDNDKMPDEFSQDEPRYLILERAITPNEFNILKITCEEYDPKTMDYTHETPEEVEDVYKKSKFGI